MWNICGLPKDDTSIENGIIIDKSRRWSLMIDPQTQANKYIKNLGKEHHEEGIDVVKMSDTNLMRTLEIAIQHGKWVLVENVGKELDPSLEPILLQQVVKSGSSLSIQIGDKTLPYNPTFRFFMTTTNPNPHYSPETFVKVCIINFAITPSGLEDQMLALIVALENPQLEQKKTEIVKKNAADKKNLVDIEDNILKSLSSASNIEDLLRDETLINTLQNAKRFAAEIQQRMQDSKITEIEIDRAREGYRPVAFRASILFFCIIDLNGIDPMYEYSLQWFMNLFTLGVENAPAAKELDQRLKNLNDYFTYSLYENICRSLFERHKLLFSFMLTVKVLFGENLMVDEEWRYLLAGASGDVHIPDNPTKWVAENQWADMYRQIYGMSQLACLNGFDTDFLKNPDQWLPMFNSQTPHTDPFPAAWHDRLNEFQKIILLKAIRTDKVIDAV
jgi:dynein heavy chain